MQECNEIFGNKMPKKLIRKAEKTKKKYIKKFGDESSANYHLKAVNNDVLTDLMGVKVLELSDKKLKLPDNAVIIGNIRMGFGHYRISIAMASCAHALGYAPYWLDYCSFPTAGGKMIQHSNELYSMGSRWSQKYKLFNKFIWEPLNSEGFKKISYNVGDQKNAELLVPIIQDLPKDVPYVATHVWPSQGAVHAGLTHVVNAIPDNWPMALHLSEGALHTVQTPFAYLGYKKLNKMDKKELKHMPDNTIFNVGHYIDHELVSNLKSDTKDRLNRLNKGQQLRFLMTVGGAGAQYPIFKSIVEFLMPYIKAKKVLLFINFGDHDGVYKKLLSEVKDYKQTSTNFIDKWEEFNQFVLDLGDISKTFEGIVSIVHKDIFKAVYSTNLLMRKSDLLITKPSELAYYPIPKMMIQRVGGHEYYGSVHASELGDGTFECDTVEEISSMFNLLLESKEVLVEMNNNILNLNKIGMYDGAYKVIKLAVNKKLD